MSPLLKVSGVGSLTQHSTGASKTDLIVELHWLRSGVSNYESEQIEEVSRPMAPVEESEEVAFCPLSRVLEREEFGRLRSVSSKNGGRAGKQVNYLFCLPLTVS